MSGRARSSRSATSSVSYGAIKALKGVSLTLAEGEIVTLIGANGAGKTTTLRAIMGLVPPSGGEVRYHGEPTRATPTHKLVRDGLVLVPEGRIVFANLTRPREPRDGRLLAARRAASRRTSRRSTRSFRG